ncbi:WD40 repeat-like protein [Terfezia boudieri ATCC MYA-4762]|uniref:WD40 repeat-like protein n=1 Tax=Terfezia boudieri ATCC MYA-4762 TaxID=1051890 RepID=A0A3N4LQK0_9PEZI|nr:WD40 repeat-like protein [Terfezia boudieri ATCC MYA-4762]
MPSDHDQDKLPGIPSPASIPNPSGPKIPSPLIAPQRGNVTLPTLVLDTTEPDSTTKETNDISIDQSVGDSVRVDPRLRPSLSQTSLGSSSRQGASTSHKFPGKLGLTVIHESTSRKLDIIFVHGLGGGSRKTWCYDGNPEIFWPEWLGDIPELSRARISIFGYNADIIANTGITQANVEWFAKELLNLLTIHGQRYEAFGRVPIIFICHSMGGLVVKRACVKASGDGDKRIREISAKINGIIFFGTPHRGSSQAKMRNSLVSLLGRGGSGRAYLKDQLNVNSALLQMLNDDFRHLATRINLFSFWEQKKTRIGSFEQMIVEQYSAILGYAQEGSAPLFADHDLICKFSSPVDPNYVVVTSTILAMVEKIFAEEYTATPGDRKRYVQEIHQFLLSPDVTSTEADFYTVQSKRLEGSCQWVTQQAWFTRWEQGEVDSNSEILWLNGHPGTGKSVISTYLIDQLKRSGHSCYYYFFKSSDVPKRTLERCLLNMAYQIALAEPEVRGKLRYLRESQFNLVGAELLLLWQKIFVSSILPIYEQKRLPLFLIIDALDETENSMAIFPLLHTLKHIPNVRLCVTSRQSIEFTQQLNLLENKIKINNYTISQRDNIDDITYLVKSTLSSLPLLEEVRVRIVNSVIQKAEGNLLWVSLVSKQMLKAGFNQESLLQVLQQVPPGMDQIYVDILAKMRTFPPKQKDIARWIILWTLSSFQPLPVSTLQEALEFKPPAEKVEALEYWVAELCGSFLVIDREKSVQPIHSTAREFLLADKTSEFAITPATHLHIASVCLKSILKANHSRHARKKSLVMVSGSSYPVPDILGIHSQTLWRYAVFWWSSHLALTSSHDLATFNLVTRVLKSATFMDCIQDIAESGDIHAFVRMAKNLKKYVSIPEIGEMAGRREDIKYISLWTVDLIRLATEFGENLLRFPSLTEAIIAPFCPRSSAIYQGFGTREGGITLLGDVPKSWDTRLAFLNTPQASPSAATTVCATSKLVAVGYQNGSISVWNSTTALLVHQLSLTEPISCLNFNQTGSCIAAGGRSRITLWNASTASEQLTISLADVPILLAFSSDDLLFIIFRNNKLKVYSVEDGTLISEFDWAEEKMSINIVAEFPLCISLNAQRTRLAVAYRGLPISLWDLEYRVYLKRFRPACRTSSHRRAHELGQKGVAAHTHDSASALEFHSQTDEIFISYSDGTFIKWDPDTSEQTVSPMHADIHVMKCSPDGTMVMTGNSHGQLKLWSTITLELLFTLEEDDEAVRRLCFSPDGSRIFDVRGVYCNVWEPEILLRGARIYRETMTPSPIPSDEHSSSITLTNPTSVTCLCPSPNGKFFIGGTDNGRVILYSLASGNKLKALYSHGASAEITSIAWSEDGSLIATGDNTSKVFVYQLSISTGPTNMAVEVPEPSEDGSDSDYEYSNLQAFELSLIITATQLLKGAVKVAGRLDGFITSLLIAEYEGNVLLMASSKNADAVWRLNKNPTAAKKVTKPVGSCLTICYGVARSRHLLKHPDNKDLILTVDPESVRIRSWPSLQKAISGSHGDQNNVSVNCETLEDNVFALHSSAEGNSHDQEVFELEGSSLSETSGNVLVMCISKSRVSQVGRQREIWVWKLDGNITTNSGNIHLIMCLGISSIATSIKAFLGVFRQKLYFLDMRGWVCSKDITSEEHIGNKPPLKDELHECEMWFFLPRGHFSTEMSSTISRIMVWKRDVIFTRKDNVIVVKRGLRGQGRRVIN